MPMRSDLNRSVRRKFCLSLLLASTTVSRIAPQVFILGAFSALHSFLRSWMRSNSLPNQCQAIVCRRNSSIVSCCGTIRQLTAHIGSSSSPYPSNWPRRKHLGQRRLSARFGMSTLTQVSESSSGVIISWTAPCLLSLLYGAMCQS